MPLNPTPNPPTRAAFSPARTSLRSCSSLLMGGGAEKDVRWEAYSVEDSAGLLIAVGWRGNMDGKASFKDLWLDA